MEISAKTGKKTKHFALMLCILSIGCLLGCQSNTPTQAAATAVGAVAGGVIGYQFGHGGASLAGAAIGAVVGGVFGSAIGEDQTALAGDLAQADRAFMTATRAPVGQTIYWKNARTGNWGYYRPIREGHTRIDGCYCREFVTRATINCDTKRAYGTVCRDPDGNWHTN